MNVYSSPEKFGLEIFAVLDCGSSCDFDMAVVFKNSTTGQLLAAFDSGCSCPVPFEDQGLDALMPVTSETWPQFEGAVQAVAAYYDEDNGAAIKGELLGKVSMYLARLERGLV